jgi:hypothetical protein
MDIHAALKEVTRWCAQRTEAGDPEALEVECHATVWITIGETAPPWRVRRELRCSSGASSPVAQLRYDVERGDWALHHGGRPGQGWCDDDEAVRADDVGPLLDEIGADSSGRFEGLPPGFRWPWQPA